jgi:hypothetical protein
MVFLAPFGCDAALRRKRLTEFAGELMLPCFRLIANQERFDNDTYHSPRKHFAEKYAAGGRFGNAGINIKAGGGLKSAYPLSIPIGGP